MAFERQVDFAAVARVARRVDLREIRLAELSARLLGEVEGESLEATTEHSSSHEMNASVLTVKAIYKFTVTMGTHLVAEMNATFRILYVDKGGEPIPDPDLSEFASANGIYHSWPFLRQLVFDLTARMGFPPYTMPSLLFNPEAKKPSPEASDDRRVEKSAGEEAPTPP